MLDEVRYSDEGVVVTSHLLKMHDRSYRISDIKYARIRTVPVSPYSQWSTLLLVVSGLTFVAWLILRNASNIVGLDISVILVFVFGLAVLISTWLSLYGKREYLYLLVISGSFGTRNIFCSMDRNQVQRLVDAIQADTSSVGLPPKE